MHAPVLNFVTRFATRAPISLIEIGSLDVNGRIRHLFPNARYTGLDIIGGPGVDIVADASKWSPPETVDMVICCEVFEHTSLWRHIIRNAIRWLRPPVGSTPGGQLVATCATKRRKPHGAHGGPLRPGEYYANVQEAEISALFDEPDMLFHTMMHRVVMDDLYLWVQRGDSLLTENSPPCTFPTPSQ